jgi:hypothetical protein
MVNSALEVKGKALGLNFIVRCPPHSYIYRFKNRINRGTKETGINLGTNRGCVELIERTEGDLHIPQTQQARQNVARMASNQ